MTKEELLETSIGFSGGVLGLSPYDWQARAILPIEDALAGIPRKVAVVAPNGSGKDGVIIPSIAYYWLQHAPQGRIIITSKSDLQLTTQTIPNLDMHRQKFGYPEPVRSPRYTLLNNTGGVLTAFVTNAGVRIEGSHSRPGSPLAVIVNEAKSVDMDIFQGLDRCTIDLLVLISSPGMRQGRFYESCTALPGWTVIHAGLADCPHIPQHHIDDVISKWGPNHPFTLSTLHGQFMSQDEGVQFTNTWEEIESCIYFPPEWRPGFKYGFFDFAEGRAENVLAIRNGNKYEIADAWREASEDAVVGRAIYLLNKYNLKNGDWGADAAAKTILDKMAQAGFVGNRQNFGQRLGPDNPYSSWSSMAWREFAEKIRRREVIIPDDPILKKQGSNRKKIITPLGKLGLEPKEIMQRDRQLESPDRWDALIGAAAQHDDSMEVKENIIDLRDFEGFGRGNSEISKCVGSY